MKRSWKRTAGQTGVLVTATILFAACPCLYAACGWPPAAEVTVLPGDEVELHLFGNWCNSCIPHVWRWEVTGNEVHVDLSHVVGICLPVGTPWEDTVTVAPLPSGCYRILAALYGVGNPMDPPFLQEEATEVAVLCHPARTQITAATDDPFFSLRWQPIGDGCVYTVEATDAMAGPHWAPVDPAGQWPIQSTSWTDATAHDAWAFPGRRFYRVRVEPQPREGE